LVDRYGRVDGLCALLKSHRHAEVPNGPTALDRVPEFLQRHLAVRIGSRFRVSWPSYADRALVGMAFGGWIPDAVRPDGFWIAHERRDMAPATNHPQKAF
jgi:hypothetical protein